MGRQDPTNSIQANVQASAVQAKVVQVNVVQGNPSTPAATPTPMTGAIASRRPSSAAVTKQSCVGAGTRDDTNDSDREAMVREISRILLARKKTPPSKEWMEELPHRARELEDRLFRNASSLEDHLDRSTLLDRLRSMATVLSTRYHAKSDKRQRDNMNGPTVSPGSPSSASPTTVAASTVGPPAGSPIVTGRKPSASPTLASAVDSTPTTGSATPTAGCPSSCPTATSAIDSADSMAVTHTSIPNPSKRRKLGSSAQPQESTKAAYHRIPLSQHPHRDHIKLGPLGPGCGPADVNVNGKDVPAAAIGFVDNQDCSGQTEDTEMESEVEVPSSQANAAAEADPDLKEAARRAEEAMLTKQVEELNKELQALQRVGSLRRSTSSSDKEPISKRIDACKASIKAANEKLSNLKKATQADLEQLIKEHQQKLGELKDESRKITRALNRKNKKRNATKKEELKERLEQVNEDIKQLWHVDGFTKFSLRESKKPLLEFKVKPIPFNKENNRKTIKMNQATRHVGNMEGEGDMKNLMCALNMANTLVGYDYLTKEDIEKTAAKSDDHEPTAIRIGLICTAFGNKDKGRYEMFSWFGPGYDKRRKKEKGKIKQNHPGVSELELESLLAKAMPPPVDSFYELIRLKEGLYAVGVLMEGGKLGFIGHCVVYHAGLKCFLDCNLEDGYRVDPEDYACSKEELDVKIYQDLDYVKLKSVYEFHVKKDDVVNGHVPQFVGPENPKWEEE